MAHWYRGLMDCPAPNSCGKTSPVGAHSVLSEDKK